MREGQTAVTRRQDYQAPAFWIDTVDLTIDLDPTKTRVLSKLVVRRNPDVPAQALKLDGDELNGRLSVATDHDGALLALHLLDQAEALGFELGDCDLHKMTMV